MSETDGVTDAPRRRRRRRLRLAVAVGLVLATGVAVWLAVRSDPSGSASTSTDLDGDGTRGFDGSAVWILSGWGEGPLWKIDPDGNMVTASTAIGSNPQQVAVAGGKVWVSDGVGGRVLAVDPATLAMRGTVMMPGSPSAMLLAFGLLWVDNEQSLQAIDPATGEIVRQIPLEGFGSGLASDGSSLWVADSRGDVVRRYDPVTGAVQAEVAVGKTPVSLVFDGQRLWVLNGADNSLSTIDPLGGVVRDTLRLGPVDEGSFVGSAAWVALVGADVWVMHLAGSSNAWGLLRIDSATGRIVERVEAACCSSGYATNGVDLWVETNAGVMKVTVRPGGHSSTEYVGTSPG